MANCCDCEICVKFPYRQADRRMYKDYRFKVPIKYCNCSQPSTVEVILFVMECIPFTELKVAYIHNLGYDLFVGSNRKRV